MLATALECDPALCFLGEYKAGNIPDHYHLTLREFFIVHADLWPLFIRNEDPLKVKRIYLTRGHQDRRYSTRVLKLANAKLHYTEPTELSLCSSMQRPGNLGIQAIEPALENIMSQLSGLTLDYEKLTDNKNMKYIPGDISYDIQEYLGLDSGIIYRPKYVKPTVRIT